MCNGTCSRFGLASPFQCTDTALQFPVQGSGTGSSWSNFLQDHLHGIRELVNGVSKGPRPHKNRKFNGRQDWAMIDLMLFWWWGKILPIFALLTDKVIINRITQRKSFVRKWGKFFYTVTRLPHGYDPVVVSLLAKKHQIRPVFRNPSWGGCALSS